MKIYCHAHPEQDMMCECPKCHEKSVLENIVKEIKRKIEDSNADFEWINGMWDTINIINKRIRELDEKNFII